MTPTWYPIRTSPKGGPAHTPESGVIGIQTCITLAPDGSMIAEAVKEAFATGNVRLIPSPKGWTEGEPPHDGRWYVLLGNLVYNYISDADGNEEGASAIGKSAQSIQGVARWVNGRWMALSGVSILDHASDELCVHWHIALPEDYQTAIAPGKVFGGAS